MTKVVIIMSYRLKQGQSSALLVERVKIKEKEAYARTGFNMTAESRGSEDGKR